MKLSFLQLSFRQNRSGFTLKFRKKFVENKRPQNYYFTRVKDLLEKS